MEINIEKLIKQLKEIRNQPPFLVRAALDTYIAKIEAAAPKQTTV